MTIKKYSKEHADLTEIIYQKMRHMVGYREVTIEDVEKAVSAIGDAVINFIMQNNEKKE